MRKPRSGKEKQEGRVSAERLVLSWALSDSGKPEALMRFLSPEDFSDEVCRRAAEELWKEWAEGRRPEPASLINRYSESEDTEAGNRVSALLLTELPEDLSEEEADRILSESVRRIRRYSLDEAARKAADPGEMQSIILQKKQIEREPISLLF